LARLPEGQCSGLRIRLEYHAASTPTTRRWPSRPIALAIRGSFDP
jgi:hypothetical protein